MIIPFKKTYTYAGLGSASGIIKFENRVFEIEYQTVDEIIRYFKSDSKQITLKLSEIESIELKKGWFSYKILIDVKSLKSLDRFPAAKGNRVKLKVSKSNREKLKNLKSSLMLALSEHKLEQLGSEPSEDESLETADRIEIDRDERLDRSSGSKNQGGLPNALERKDQTK